MDHDIWTTRSTRGTLHVMATGCDLCDQHTVIPHIMAAKHDLVRKRRTHVWFVVCSMKIWDECCRILSGSSLRDSDG